MDTIGKFQLLTTKVACSDLMYTIGLIAALTHESLINTNKGEASNFKVVWIYFLIVLLFVCTNMWAACTFQLNKNPEADPVLTLAKACIWRNFNIVGLLATLATTGYWYTNLEGSLWLIVIIASPLAVFFRGILVLCICKLICHLIQIPKNSSTSMIGGLIEDV